MLRAPLSTVTLLHRAEATARVPGKRRVTCRMPMLEDGRAVWGEFRDIDTANGALPCEEAAAGVAATPGMAGEPDALAAIATQAPAAGIGRRDPVGAAERVLFPPADLHRLAEGWMEARFGQCGNRSSSPGQREPLPWPFRHVEGCTIPGAPLTRRVAMDAARCSSDDWTHDLVEPSARE